MRAPTSCASAQRLVALQERAFRPELVPAPDPMRTTPAPPEVMQVVAAVLGHRGRRRRLTHDWQRTAAIQAMASLGDSAPHIARVLWLSARTVEKHARRAGLAGRTVDGRLDHMGIFIASLGGRIALHGDDRIAAVRVLARQGLTSAQIAHRLLEGSAEAISKVAANNGIDLLDIDAGPAEIFQFAVRQRAARPTQELLAA